MIALLIRNLLAAAFVAVAFFWMFGPRPPRAGFTG